MKSKSTPLLDVVDRFFELANSAAARGFSKVDSGNHGLRICDWPSILDGSTAMITVERGNTFYVRYVPRESVQWLFDLTQ